MALEPDWGTLTVTSLDQKTTQAVIEERKKRITNPWIGRDLYGMFHQAGLTDVEMLPFISRKLRDGFENSDKVFKFEECAKKILCEERAEEWVKNLKKLGDLYWVGLNLYVVVGRKPHSSV